MRTALVLVAGAGGGAACGLLIGGSLGLAVAAVWGLAVGIGITVYEHRKEKT